MFRRDDFNWTALVFCGAVCMWASVAFGQSPVDEVTVPTIVESINEGAGWAAAGGIIGLFARTFRLLGLRNLFGTGAARIVSLVVTALLGVSAGMIEGNLTIGLEAVVTAIMGILAGEAAAKRTEARES
jgi:hypothetical protein